MESWLIDARGKLHNRLNSSVASLKLSLKQLTPVFSSQPIHHRHPIREKQSPSDLHAVLIGGKSRWGVWYHSVLFFGCRSLSFRQNFLVIVVVECSESRRGDGSPLLPGNEGVGAGQTDCERQGHPARVIRVTLEASL